MTILRRGFLTAGGLGLFSLPQIVQAQEQNNTQHKRELIFFSVVVLHIKICGILNIMLQVRYVENLTQFLPMFPVFKLVNVFQRLLQCLTNLRPYDLLLVAEPHIVAINVQVGG